jgi:GAF domain-containing protein
LGSYQVQNLRIAIIKKREKKLEQTVKQRTSELAKEKAIAVKNRREIEKLNEFSKKINEMTGYQQVLEQISNYLELNFDIDGLWLLLLNEKKEFYTGYYSTKRASIPTESLHFIRDFRAPVSREIGTIYFAYKRKRPFYLREISESNRRKMSPIDYAIYENLQLESFIISPLVVQDKVIGVVFLGKYGGAMNLSRDDVSSIYHFCEQIAGAIHSSTLLKEVQTEREKSEKAHQEIAKLNEFSKIINETMNLDDILALVFDYVESRFNIEGALLQLVDQTTNELYYYKTNIKPFHTEEMIQYITNLRIPLKEESGTTWAIYNKKRKFYLKRIRKNRLRDDDPLHNLIKIVGLKSFLCVPLLIQNNVIGIMFFSNYSGLLELSKTDITSISHFCEQIAGAIHSSNLLKQVQKEQEQSEKARQEIEKSYQNVNVLSTIGKDIIASLSVEKIIATVYENVNKLMDASVFGIGIYNVSKKTIECPGFMEKGKKLPSFSIPLYNENRPATWCLFNQKTVLLNDVYRDAPKYNFPITPVQGEMPESTIYIPVTSKNKRIGVITVQSFNKNAYSHYHVNILRNLATYSAIALDNAEAYQNLNETRKNIEKLNQFTKQINETTNLDLIIDSIFEYLESNYQIAGSMLQLVDTAKNELYHYKSTIKSYHTDKQVQFVKDLRIPLGQNKGVIGRICNRKKPIFFPSISRFKLNDDDPLARLTKVGNLETGLIIPLVIQENVIGMMYFSNFQSKLKLSKTDITSISRFCEQIAGAIYSSNLLKEVSEEQTKAEKARTDTEKLNEFSKKINETTDCDTIFKQIFKYMEYNFDVDAWWILQVDKDKQAISKLSHAAGENRKKTTSTEDMVKATEYIMNFQVPLIPETGSLYQTYKRKRYMYFPKIPKFLLKKFPVDREIYETFKFEGFLHIPLIIQNEVIGIACIGNYEKFRLKKSDITSISQFCEQIAGAIHSSSLLRQVQEEQEDSEKARKEIEKSYQNINLLSKIGKDIIASLSVEKIIDTVYENVNKLMDASAFGIGIYNESKDVIEFPGFIEKEEKLPFHDIEVGSGTRPATWCYKNQKELFFNDIENDYKEYNFPYKAMEGDMPESIIYLPVTTKNKALGVITVQSFNKNAYTNYHLNILRNLATYCAIALDNAEAYQNLNETRKNIEKLNQFTKQINETTNLDYILKDIFKYIETIFHMDGIWLLQIDKENNEIYTIKNTLSYPKFSNEAIDFLDNFRIKLNPESGTLWRTYHRKKPFYLSNIQRVQKKAKPADRQLISKLNIDAILEIPLVIHEDTIGIICMTRLGETMNLSRDDIASISRFCEQIAGAIHSSTLLKITEDARFMADVSRLETEKARVEIEKLNEFTRKINETIELDVVLDHISVFFEENFYIEGLWILMIDKLKKELFCYGTSPGLRISEEAINFTNNFRVPLAPEAGTLYRTYKKRRPFYLKRLVDSRITNPTDRQVFKKLKLKSFLHIPLQIHNEVIAILSGTSYKNKMLLTREDIETISRFCQQIAGAINSSSLMKQVQEEQEKTEKARREIEKLSEFSKKINETTNIGEILNMIFTYFEDVYRIEGVWLLLVDKEKNELHTSHYSAGAAASEKLSHFSESFRIPLMPESGSLYRTYKRKRPLYLKRIPKDINLNEIDTMIIKSFGFNSFIHIPLLIQNEVIGILNFTNFTKPLDLKKSDIASISHFCEQIAGAIYSSSLFKKVEEEREKSDSLLNAIMQDLEKARHIQQSLLPKKMPSRKDIKLGARYIPMEQVGGDLYDFIEFPNDRLGIFIADVSGHGIPAAMVSSMAKLVLAIFGGVISSPSEYLSYLNKFIEGKIGGNFLTCFYCIIDPVNKVMHYANAGHPPFLHIRNGKISQLFGKGKLVGVFDELDIEEKQLPINKGDRFLFYTDGITEVFNSEDEEFGEDRLADVTLMNRELPLEKHLNEILYSATEFGGTQEMQDDVTLVGLEII